MYFIHVTTLDAFITKKGKKYRETRLIVANMFGIAVPSLMQAIYNWLYKPVLDAHKTIKNILKENIWDRVNRVAFMNVKVNDLLRESY